MEISTLTIDRKTRDVIAKNAAILTTFADAGPGLIPNAQVADLVVQAQAKVAPLVNRVIGEAATDLLRTENPAGESTLGNLIADAQRTALGTDFAFMNPGGIRADLLAGSVTFGELFTVQATTLMAGFAFVTALAARRDGGATPGKAPVEQGVSQQEVSG